jgi:hypothetical protein
MATANLAWMLANSSANVLAVDANLEAPRLAEPFHPFWPDRDPRLEIGVLEVLWKRILHERKPESERRDPPDRDSLTDYVLPLCCQFPQGGALNFIGPGRHRGYALRRAEFPWADFYSTLSGLAYIDDLRSNLKHSYDYVVIDGPNLYNPGMVGIARIADVVLYCLDPHGRDARIVAQLVRTATDGLPPDRSATALPVLMRARNEELELQDAARSRVRAEFRGFGGAPADDVLELREIPYFGYREVIAAFVHEDLYNGPPDPSSLYACYARILAVAVQKSLRFQSIPIGHRDAVLNKSNDPPGRLMPWGFSTTGIPERLSPSPTRPIEIFVSYSRSDLLRIKMTLVHIQELDYAVWWDEGIDPGLNWQTILKSRIGECRAVVLFISTESCKSAWVEWELSQARLLGRPVIPLILDKAPDIDPGSEVGRVVKEIQYIDDPGVGPSDRLERSLRRAVGYTLASTQNSAN